MTYSSQDTKPGTICFDMPKTSRKALMEGTWDPTRMLLANMGKIRETAQRIPYRFSPA